MGDLPLPDDDAPAAERDGGVPVVVLAELVVVEHEVRGPVPNLDPEPVRPAPAVELPVDGGEEEPVVPGPVDGPLALVWGPGPGDDEPLVGGALEVQGSRLELELRLARGDRGARLPCAA